MENAAAIIRFCMGAFPDIPRVYIHEALTTIYCLEGSTGARNLLQGLSHTLYPEDSLPGLLSICIRGQGCEIGNAEALIGGGRFLAVRACPNIAYEEMLVFLRKNKAERIECLIQSDANLDIKQAHKIHVITPGVYRHGISVLLAELRNDGFDCLAVSTRSLNTYDYLEFLKLGKQLNVKTAVIYDFDNIFLPEDRKIIFDAMPLLRGEGE